MHRPSRISDLSDQQLANRSASNFVRYMLTTNVELERRCWFEHQRFELEFARRARRNGGNTVRLAPTS